MTATHNAHDENVAFLNASREKPVTGFAAFRAFLWNSKEKKFLGRSGLSWLEITVFYIIFYSLLAAFWAVLMAGFVFTLDDKVPRWYGKGSIIGINPGVGYQPWLENNPDSTLIYINKADPESYKAYVNQMNATLFKYNNKTMTRQCTGSQSNQDNVDKACQFDTAVFEPDCTLKNGYGYPEGKPCVLLSLNRLIDWVPVAYPDKSEPHSIEDRYSSGDVTFDCRGENLPDQEHLGVVEYLPKSGLDKKYFPYKVMTNYHQPVAMVKFNSLTENILVQVECVAYAYNIVQDPQVRMGLIHFEVMVDNRKVVEKARR